MATVKDPYLTPMAKPHENKNNSPSDFNMANRLMAALKAVTKPTITTKGLLRDLLCKDSSLAMAIGGHRGMGENLLNDNEELHFSNLWRENTIHSFRKAHQHGASFVEMDVQVTRDGVPVIWHDDEIAFGSQTMPFTCQIKDLTFEEFQSLGPQSSSENGQIRELIALHRKFRNRRIVQNQNSASEKFTTWRCFDDDALPSLDQVLTTLPESLSLNLEIKMTTPNTFLKTPDEEVLQATQPIVDLLKGFFQSGSSRRILLSSFDPEVCIELKSQLKAAQLEFIPVMFITTGGSCPHVDPRQMSISAAIEFCLDHEIGGFVVDTLVLRRQKHMMEVANKNGLFVATYGLENDDVEWLLEQWKIGVNSAIVDDVAKVVPRYIQQVQSTFALATNRSTT